jgi:hypothetical protein
MTANMLKNNKLRLLGLTLFRLNTNKFQIYKRGGGCQGDLFGILLPTTDSSLL